MTISVDADLVGSGFVDFYYKIIQDEVESGYRFYKDASIVVRVDGNSTVRATTVPQINALITSQKLDRFEIKNTNFLESLGAGLLLMVSGSVKYMKSSGCGRKFVQTFFLAPQEIGGYFILNDILQFVDDESATTASSKNHHHSQPTNSSVLQKTQDLAVPEDGLEVDATESVSLVNIEGDDHVDEINVQETHLQPAPEAETVLESSALIREIKAETVEEGETHSVVEEVKAKTVQENVHAMEEVKAETVQESEPVMEEVKAETVEKTHPVMEESILEEPSKLTYASVLLAPKGKYVPPHLVGQPTKSMPPAFNGHYQTPKTATNLSSVSSSVTRPGMDVAKEGCFRREGESKSIYIKNLPFSISTIDIMLGFNKFGRIKRDGVFIRNRKEIGVCYAFVDFEDPQSAQNAVKASPVALGGRKVYIEHKRENNNNNNNGGGRGSNQTEAALKWASSRGRYQHANSVHNHN